MDQRATHTEHDSLDLDQLKAIVHDRLRQQRAVSEAIWDAGRAMYEADRRGLWPQDMPQGGGRRKKPTREAWAFRAFKIRVRQARKYFGVGEHLGREYVAGTGLCLDRMEQLYLAPVELRDLVRDLGVEGLSPRALRRGRLAAMPLLAEGRVQDALGEAERVARRCDAREDRQEQPKAPRPPRDDDQDDGPDAETACALADAALLHVESMKTLPADMLDRARLEYLARIGEELAQGCRQLLDRQPEPEDRQETAAAAPPPRQVYERPAPNMPIAILPLLAAARALAPAARERLEQGLCAAVAGKPAEEVEALLRRPYEDMVRAGAPAELAGNWMALLTDEDREGRGRFALWFGRKMESSALSAYLASLSDDEVPPWLRRDRESSGAP